MKFRLLLLPLVLAACSQSPQSAAPAPSTTTASAPTAAVSAPPVASAPAATTASDTSLLGRYHWRLSNATDSSGKRIDALFVRADRPVQLDFNANHLSVTNSCNNMGGEYSVQDGQLQIGPMMHTMMACADPGLTALDGAIGQRLQGSLKLTLQADPNTPNLQLVTGSGDTLSFTGAPTAETRYGGPGETAFLEVAAQTVPCNPLVPSNHPVLSNHPMLGSQCLQVRDRSFDEHGLPSGTPGEWHPLNQDIEGYTHEPGIRNVLRVKRFTIQNPPANSPSSAYVLDMVVESEKVKQ
jgi:heat shock protein HslJ